MHIGGGLSQGWRLDLRALWGCCYHNTVADRICEIRLSTPVSCYPSWCQGDVHEDDAWRMLGRNPVEVGPNSLVAMLENRATSVAAFVQVKREPLPSMTAYAGCCEHLVASENDKSCCFWQVSFHFGACLAWVTSTCNINVSTAPWSYLLSLFQRRRALNNWVAESLFAYCVAACRMRWSGYRVDYTGRSRWHPLLLSLTHWAIDKELDFLKLGALPLGRCGDGMFYFWGAMTIGNFGFTVGI